MRFWQKIGGLHSYFELYLNTSESAQLVGLRYETPNSAAALQISIIKGRSLFKR